MRLKAIEELISQYQREESRPPKTGKIDPEESKAKVGRIKTIEEDK